MENGENGGGPPSPIFKSLGGPGEGATEPFSRSGSQRGSRPSQVDDADATLTNAPPIVDVDLVSTIADSAAPLGRPPTPLGGIRAQQDSEIEATSVDGTAHSGDPAALAFAHPPPPSHDPLAAVRYQPRPAPIEISSREVDVHTPSNPPVIVLPHVLGAPSRPPLARGFGIGAGWPFVPLAPLVVVVVGLAVALGIGLVGLDHLARAGDEHAGARADLLAAAIAARLSQLPPDRRLEATQLAARRSPGAEILVVTGLPTDPRIVHDVTLGAPDALALSQMLVAGRGVANMRLGRARFAVRAIEEGERPGQPRAPPGASAIALSFASDGPRVVAMVPEPPSAAGATALVSALLALAILLLGVAATVAYAVSRDVTRDVDFVTRRVSGMAQVRTEPTGELIPARTMDEVGLLTNAFNKLVGRFGKAEKAYRGDLARASAADRERAAFLAAVSHELRSPLNAILGFADILMEEVDGPLSPSAREEVEQIRGSGVHLLALINDILEFSALESGQLKLSRGRVDLAALANEVAREARGLVGQKPLALRVEADPSVVARVDHRRVRQVLGNLVNNAIKFTQRGEVVVRVGRENGMAMLAVTDTGPGISPQERALIFQEYKQARGERQRRRGTGLGLAIARRLVLLHHGSIQVESELGRGSTFKVLLPIGNVDAAPSIRPPSRVQVPR